MSSGVPTRESISEVAAARRRAITSPGSSLSRRPPAFPAPSPAPAGWRRRPWGSEQGGGDPFQAGDPAGLDQHGVTGRRRDASTATAPSGPSTRTASAPAARARRRRARPGPGRTPSGGAHRHQRLDPGGGHELPEALVLGRGMLPSSAMGPSTAKRRPPLPARAERASRAAAMDVGLAL